MKNLSEVIKDFENTRAAKAARMQEIIEKSSETGETLDAAQEEEYDGLKTEVEKVDKHLVRLREQEKVVAGSAAPVDGTGTTKGTESRDPAARIVVKAAVQPLPGIRFAQVVKCMGMAHRKHRDAAAVAREMYPDDALIAKAVEAGTTISGNWAAPLVGEEGQVFADFVEFLRPQTILGKFGNNGIPGLRPAEFFKPIVTQTAGGEGYWVGEGKAKPLTKFAFTRAVMLPTKVANIAVLTEENIKYSSPKSDVIVRDALSDALRERMDLDFINPDKAAVAGVSPASITNGITPIPSSGVAADDVRTDITAVLGAFIAANNPPTSGVWIMSALQALQLSMMRTLNGEREFDGISMTGGTFFGMPVIVSEYVASDDYGAIVALVNASDIHLADEGGINVDTSREASLEMSEAPAHNSGTPTAAQLVSMFQTNSVAIRAEREINWARRRESAVQWLSDVLWAA